MSSTRALTEGPVRSTLLRFTLPFVAASLLQFLYGAADLIIVGRFSDAAGMAAVNTGCQVMQTVTGLILGLSTGGTVLIGQYAGARREEDVSKTIGTMFTFFALIALVLTAVLTLGTDRIIALMKVPEEAVGPARQYFFICACGTLLIAGYNAVSGMLRGLGDSKRPMVFVAIACAVNIIGDLLLVGYFHMGAAGAAIATVVAQGISLLLSILVLRGRNFPFDFRLGSFRLWPGKVWKVLQLGGPVALQNVLVEISFLIITARVNHLGLAQSAAVGVTERIISFYMLAPVAFQAAISAMTAQNIGARLPERAREALRCGLLYSFLSGSVMLALLELFPAQTVGIFTPDTQVIFQAVQYIRSYGIDCVLVSFVFCLNGFFSGCGHTFFTMANCLAATFLVRIPVVMVVSGLPDVTMFQIGLAAPAASLLQIAIQLVYLKSGRWRSGSLVEQERAS